ncbi:MAG TPA: hypothetical protein VFZ21_20120 [Gemmatimonadaceae bacterium]|nr:hypothetical protein [Gemmatimonadaceae bacterium]
MTNLRLIASVSLALGLGILPGRIDAQIGGLIKKKVTESVKGGDRKGGKEEAAANETAKSKMPRPITANTFVAFKKGLTVQRDKQQETLKFLAGITPVEKYRSCAANVMMTPEGQKIVLQIPTPPDDATVQQLQAYGEKLGAEMKKLTDKQCGEDPSKYDFQWRRDRFTEARVAAVAAFSAALDSPSGSGGGPYLAVDLEGMQQQQGRDDNYFFDLLIEWTPPFCRLSKAAQQAAAENGIAVQGSSKGLNYVYTAMEARLLMPQCEEIMMLLDVLEK